MSRLHLHILGSGSKGNCALVEGPQGLIMIDNGLSRRETLKRMAELGLSADDVAALVITHEHGDHIKGLDVWCKHWHGPLFASRDTLSCKENLAHLPVEEFDPGDTLTIAGIQVQTYSTSHELCCAKDRTHAFFRSASCPQRGISPTTKPPKPRENLLPIAQNSSSPCTSARTIIAQALPSKAMPTRLMQVSMMNSAAQPPVFKGHGSSRYALQVSINRQLFNSPLKTKKGGWESLPSPLNSYSRLKQSHR